ncbi:MAG: mandelate racemase/muconate lactonizing enzyme family protein [Acidimicrobiales bacterium]
MKIVDVEALVLRPGEVDTARADGTQDAFLVRIHTDEGLIGIGEGDTSPYVGREMVTMPSSHSVARGFRELLIGEDPLRVRPLWRRMFEATYHYGRDGAALHVLSAVDMALWDLLGKAADQPVKVLLGGEEVATVAIYACEVMPVSRVEARALATEVAVAGFDALKLGWGPLGNDPGLDEELVAAARSALGPDRRLMIDGGMNYSLRSARNFCRRVERYDLFWFEEPFEADDLRSYTRLADSVNVRVACGEAHSRVAVFSQLLEAGVDILQPDLGRCGGFTVARDIAALLSVYGGALIIPHCFSTDVLLAATLQYASSLPRERLIEYPVTASKRLGTILTAGLTPEGGSLRVPSGPGLGIDLDENEISRRRVS